MGQYRKRGKDMRTRGLDRTGDLNASEEDVSDWGSVVTRQEREQWLCRWIMKQRDSEICDDAAFLRAECRLM